VSPPELNITIELKSLLRPDLQPIVHRLSATRFEVCVVVLLCYRPTSVLLGTFWARCPSGNARDRRRARRRTDRAVAMLVAKHGATVSKVSWARPGVARA
jgi:hypothetical protein